MLKPGAVNILIVEDQPHWRGIYEEQARLVGVGSVRMAGTKSEAIRHIDEMEFAVAFVDIGLDDDDDRNVDGLRVMERIRAVGDETSIIVVTGRTGSDVLPIAREAILTHRAFDTVGKAQIGPTEIRDLLSRAIEDFANRRRLPAAHHVLRGGATAWDWDDRMMRVTGIKGGSRGLYGFLEQLAGPLLPIVPARTVQTMRINGDVRMAFGEYWSRRSGEPLLIVFGPSDAVDAVFADSPRLRPPLTEFEVEKEIRGANAGSVKGRVFSLRGRVRSDFQALGVGVVQ